MADASMYGWPIETTVTVGVPTAVAARHGT
jgi:hypothetical protein